MGMYTEIYVSTDLKEGTPEPVIDVLRAICAKDPDSPALAEHPDRWFMLFNSGSYYTPLTEVASLTYDDIGKHYSLIGKGDIKNYGYEIEKFFDWLKPWCDNEFIGYHRYEEAREPTLVYANPYAEQPALDDHSSVVSFQ